MKKIIIRVLILLVVLVVLAVLAVGLFLDRAIKAGVETAGPKLTGVEVKLQSVSLSVLSGSGSIKGLVVGNPEGFKTPSAISIGAASIALKPGSLLSDKVVVTSIKIEAPEITFETDLRANNLSKIMANVEAATGRGGTEAAKPKEAAPTKEGKPGKKLQVDDVLITGGKIAVSVTALGGKAQTVALKEIHLQNLGAGPEGITAGELTKALLKEIEKGAVSAASETIADIKKGGLFITKDLGTGGSNATEKVSKGLGNLFKSK
jgi:uncharacterized protein involved in outer membrane biogenesis